MQRTYLGPAKLVAKVHFQVVFDLELEQTINFGPEHICGLQKNDEQRPTPPPDHLISPCPRRQSTDTFHRCCWK
jgi:hypothetical protein